MRLSVILLAAAALGVAAGAWLIGRWTGVGAAVVFDSLCTGAWALFHDDGVPQAVQGAPTLADILERNRQAS